MENLPFTSPFMLRNDGQLLSCGEIHPYILMSVKSSLKTNIEALNNRPDFLDWFYNNTLQEDVKNLIKEFKENNNPDILEKLNTLTNNEFCRVRTSNYKIPYGGDNGQIYFRISSNNDFNWFDLIYNVLLQYDNLDYVTVVKDAQAFKDIKDFDYYKINGQEINQMSVEDFLTLEGSPIIESPSYIDAGKIVENNLSEALYGMNGKEVSFENLVKTIFKQKIIDIFANTPNIVYCDVKDINSLLTTKGLLPKPFFTFVSNTPGAGKNDPAGRITHYILYGKASKSIDMIIQDHTRLHNKINGQILTRLPKTMQDIYDRYYIKPLNNIGNIKETYANDVIRIALFENCIRCMVAKLKEFGIDMTNLKVNVNQDITKDTGIKEALDSNKAGIKSNGIYSVLNNEWIKKPIQTDIPDINQEEFDKLFNEWENKYFTLLNKLEDLREESK